MKTLHLTPSGIVALVLIVTACALPNRIQTQYDNATDTKNYRWDHRIGDMRLRSPLVYLDQSFVKQLNGHHLAQYRLYDNLVLHANEFRLGDQVFILLDDKPVALQPQKREDDVMVSKDVKRDDILTADSTTVSVVTGYREDHYRVTRFEYVLASEVVEQIQRAKSIQFRYYSGSNIITVCFPAEKVMQLKKLFTI